MENNLLKKRQHNLGIKFLFFVGLLVFLFSFVIAVPQGVDVEIINESTRTVSAGYEINTSGGSITTANITARLQNFRWKAFVGNVSGSFSLDDASGSTIYDWSMAVIGGQVYATRNESTISWGDIACADVADLEAENLAMNLTNAYDNITATFSLSTNHDPFSVGGVPIANCDFYLKTYVSGESQDGTDFFEAVVLTDEVSGLIYSTKIEGGEVGYDGSTFDFQMIVPENPTIHSQGSSTAYYLYVELT